MPNNQSS